MGKGWLENSEMDESMSEARSEALAVKGKEGKP